MSDSTLPESVGSDDAAETRRELLEEITRVGQAAAKGIAFGRTLIESSQRMTDLAGTLMPIVERAPTASIAVSSTDWSESYGFPNIEPLLHLQRQWIMPATVKELLHALGLDVSRGQNLREAIHVAVDELLKRRPVTSRIDGGLKGKITALASQCGRPTNTSEAIDRVAESAACLIDELSATKNKNADRGRVRTLFVQGLGVLESVANLIDASKLRSP